MAEINTPGSLLVGEGVFMKGSMRVPGVASIDGKVEGDLTADTVLIQGNGSIDGRTTADHVRVAGALTNTTVANKTLVVESSGMVSGTISYTDLEIKKGGSLQGNIHKVGEEPKHFGVSPAPAPAPPPRSADRPMRRRPAGLPRAAATPRRASGSRRLARLL